MPFEDASCARSGAIAVKIENVETVGAEAVPAVVEQLANAARGRLRRARGECGSARAEPHARTQRVRKSHPTCWRSSCPMTKWWSSPSWLASTAGLPIGLPSAPSTSRRARSHWRSSPSPWALSRSR